MDNQESQQSNLPLTGQDPNTPLKPEETPEKVPNGTEENIDVDYPGQKSTYPDKDDDGSRQRDGSKDVGDPEKPVSPYDPSGDPVNPGDPGQGQPYGNESNSSTAPE